MSNSEINKQWEKLSLYERHKWNNIAERIPIHHKLIFLTGFDLFVCIHKEIGYGYLLKFKDNYDSSGNVRPDDPRP